MAMESFADAVGDSFMEKQIIPHLQVSKNGIVQGGIVSSELPPKILNIGSLRSYYMSS